MQREEKLHTFSDYICVAAIILIGLVPRLYLLWITDSGIESDEAIVGLMAKHINEGKPWPIFYYGQYYMGSLEALLVALSFRLFGQSNFALKLVPFLFSLVHIALVYALARRFTDRFGSWVAAILVALGPSALILWSTKARGGFIELVVIGSYSLLISVDILRKSQHRARELLVLGVVLGVGWWVNNQIIFYIAAIAIAFSIHFFRTYGPIRTIVFVWWSSIGFFIGSAPFWWANLVESPRLVTFKSLLGRTSSSGGVEQLEGFFSNALPIIFGARRFWSATDIFPGSTSISYAAYLIVVILYVLCWLSSAREKHGPPFGLLLLFCFSVAAIFSASSFGSLSMAPRYLLPLYSVLTVVVGVGVSFVRRSGFSTPLPLSIVAVLLAINLSSSYLGGVSVPGQPVIFEGQKRGERVVRDHRPLYSWLDEFNYSHIRTNYWVGYRTAFETDERVTFSRFGRPRSLRIPGYERRSLEDDKYAVYVLSPGEGELWQRTLRAFGYVFRTSSVGGYSIIDHVKSLRRPSERLQLRADQLRVSSRQSWARNMLDQTLGTRWGSGEPQHPGMEVSVTLDTAVNITGIDISFGFFLPDAPRHLVIEARNQGDSWCELFNSQHTKVFYDLERNEFGEIPRTWHISFPPRLVDNLRLRQLGSAKVFDWSIAELSVFRLKETASRLSSPKR